MLKDVIINVVNINLKLGNFDFGVDSTTSVFSIIDGIKIKLSRTNFIFGNVTYVSYNAILADKYFAGLPKHYSV